MKVCSRSHSVTGTICKLLFSLRHRHDMILIHCYELVFLYVDVPYVVATQRSTHDCIQQAVQRPLEAEV
jgi:hypothetical protein